MKVLIWISLFTLAACACGISANTQVIDQASTDVKPTEQIANYPAERITRGQVCESGGLNVRSEPGLDAPVIAVKNDGDTVTLTGDVELRDGVLWLSIGGGWVSGKYICIGE